jgi:hypothetical protein
MSVILVAVCDRLCRRCPVTRELALAGPVADDQTVLLSNVNRLAGADLVVNLCTCFEMRRPRLTPGEWVPPSFSNAIGRRTRR